MEDRFCPIAVELLVPALVAPGTAASSDEAEETAVDSGIAIIGGFGDMVDKFFLSVQIVSPKQVHRRTGKVGEGRGMYVYMDGRKE